MQKNHLKAAPNNPQRVIRATDLTGTIRAFEAGLDNSVNATKSGGAATNLKSNITAGTIIAAAKSVRIKIFPYSFQRGFGSGKNSFFFEDFSLFKSRSAQQNKRCKRHCGNNVDNGVGLKHNRQNQCGDHWRKRGF